MSRTGRKAPSVTIAERVARGARGLAAGVVLAAALSSVAAAQTPSPGTLDVGFGEDGRVLTPVGPFHEVATSVAMDDQGRMVVAGYTYDETSGEDFLVARYLADGTLDPDFGAAGVVVTPMGLGAANDRATAMLIQPDGRIVAVGETFASGAFRVAVVRYHPDGALDSSFGGTGRVLTDPGGSVRVRAVTRQADGKILVAGAIHKSATVWDIFVGRYYANGARDLDFGASGVFTAGISGQQEAVGVALTATGRMVVAAGDPQVGSSFLLARLYADGELDWTFGSFGLVHTPLSTELTVARAMAVQPDGKIVVAADANGGYAVLARYHPNGTLDSGFDGDGLLTLQLSPNDVYVGDVVVQPNGKIVLAGSADFGGALIRIDAGGTPDTGLVLTPLGPEGGGFSGVALQADGKIVAAGSANIAYADYDLAVARYWGDVVDLIFTDGFDSP
jgi:uncharacterized delta-60 repeat protein